MTLRNSSLDLFPASMVTSGGLEFALARTPAGLRLALFGFTIPELFHGERSELVGRRLCLCPLEPANAAALRSSLDWLRPRCLGLHTSVGMGDRLGLATPGHVRAMQAAGGSVLPIFAQQSIREMARTHSSPQEVMDAATWGMFQEGWRGGAGADADHLKTPADIDACLAAGYTFFTIDPGEHVGKVPPGAGENDLRRLAETLPADVQPALSGLSGKRFEIEQLQITFDEVTLLTAALKYGRAVAHAAQMYHHLQAHADGRPWELEVSVDETETPTTHAEHIYIASELQRLGVEWVSLAPRYVGRFEKGVDYIGPLEAFDRDFSGHAAIARRFGPYKLSLHSGSDKFSIYPSAVEHTRGLVHLKTAGTSYLEALRTLAALDSALFREIYDFALERYDHDRASYHVSAEVQRAPLPGAVRDWPALLENFDAREILHVTFGSVLTDRDALGELRFRERLMDFLAANAEAYAERLEKHFIHHLQPFAAPEAA